MGKQDPYKTRSGTPAADPLATRYPAVVDHHRSVSATDSKAPTQNGQKVGNYSLQRQLGQGGMGVVYLATHSQFSDRKYAVKIISAGLASVNAAEQFRREVEAIGKSQHPNLLYAIDAGSHNGQLYLVTEFIAGKDLGHILHDCGRLPVSTVCEIGRQLAVGLAFAHSKGIVHRDIKPQNVMLEPSGRVKILDLGLASVRNANETNQSIQDVVGTPPYMPPEQWLPGESVTSATDVYALGCTLYELLTGQTPFPVCTFPDQTAQRQAHLERQPPRLTSVAPHVSADVGRLIDRCLEKHPSQRPASGEEIVAVLESHAEPIVAGDFLGTRDDERSAAASAGAEFKALIDEPRSPDTSRSRMMFFVPLVVGLLISIGGLAQAYYGAGATAAWRLRFDRLGEPRLPSGTGFAIEAARAVLFLTLVTAVAYVRFRLPLQRFLSPRFHNLRVWIARGLFSGMVFTFLTAEFSRQWFPENAARDMTAWALERGLATTPLQEVIPYRWYLGYSLVNYFVVFGGLLLLPILQFLLADLPFLQRATKLFRLAQKNEPNAMTAVDRLYSLARTLRQLTARYVDTAGVLAIGVQYEYWIGRWTLTETGYLIEVVGMLVTAGVMVLILTYIAIKYTDAVDSTTASQGANLDHRVEQRVQQFSLSWFLRTTVFSRASGIALLSLILLAIVAGRRVVP